MTKARDCKPAPLRMASKTQGKLQGGAIAGQVIGPAVQALLPTAGKGSSLLGLSAAFVVGAAVGAAIGSDQAPASGADIRLPLDDEPGDTKATGHQADYDCGL